MFRRLALALLLVVPGVVVVRAGLADAGVQRLDAPFDRFRQRIVIKVGVEPERSWDLSPGDLLGRVSGPLGLSVGRPPLLTLYIEPCR